jgi:hypothetical protein
LYKFLDYLTIPLQLHRLHSIRWEDDEWLIGMGVIVHNFEVLCHHYPTGQENHKHWHNRLRTKTWT